MTNDKPPVAPIERHYAMLRNGMIARPVLDDWPENPPYFDAFHEIYWERDGRAQPATKSDLDVRSAPLYDIIATISPETMMVAAGLVDLPELQSLYDIIMEAEARHQEKGATLFSEPPADEFLL